jgi:hypothetical protein
MDVVIQLVRHGTIEYTSFNRNLEMLVFKRTPFFSIMHYPNSFCKKVYHQNKYKWLRNAPHATMIISLIIGKAGK